MEKKINQKNKIIIISVACLILISVSAYFIFFRHDNRDFKSFNSNDGRMGNFQLTPETENEITSFFESSPSDVEIENYCLENPMYCGYYCQNSDAEFCETIKPEGLPNETSS
ncbi:MAG: hypothetical protein WC511_00985 [Candidatus Pacearchaeota archaeon]